MPKPLELCEQGDFEKLFELYYDKANDFKIHGYQSDDYLTKPDIKHCSEFVSNIDTKKKLAKLRYKHDHQRVSNLLPSEIPKVTNQFTMQQLMAILWRCAN